MSELSTFSFSFSFFTCSFPRRLKVQPYMHCDSLFCHQVPKAISLRQLLCVDKGVKGVYTFVCEVGACRNTWPQENTEFSPDLSLINMNTEQCVVLQGAGELILPYILRFREQLHSCHLWDIFLFLLLTQRVHACFT